MSQTVGDRKRIHGLDSKCSKWWLKKVFCKYGKGEIRAQHSDLFPHAANEKHKNNPAPFSNTRILFDTGRSFLSTNVAVNEAELKLTAHDCSSTLTVDQGVSLYRTKCTALINSLIGPADHHLLADIGSGPCSLIVDDCCHDQKTTLSRHQILQQEALKNH